ncbi:CRPV-101 [Crowpox virus]|nr:CRPV-101 [Crowpox virus]
MNIVLLFVILLFNSVPDNIGRSWRHSFLYTLCYLIPIEPCLISTNITLLELKSKILLLLLRVVK